MYIFTYRSCNIEFNIAAPICKYIHTCAYTHTHTRTNPREWNGAEDFCLSVCVSGYVNICILASTVYL